MNATFMPVVVSTRDQAYRDRFVLDGLFDDLAVGYSVGRPFGNRLLTWAEFERLDMSRRELRRRAAHLLDSCVERVGIHGQPPALMLSFEGIESSLILCESFWDGLERYVPGSIVVGVPARDMVIVTGSRSPAGIAKARRAVDRMFLAGGRHLLRPGLMIRRADGWRSF